MEHWIICTLKFKFDDPETAEKFRAMLDDYLPHGVVFDLGDYQETWADSLAEGDEDRHWDPEIYEANRFELPMPWYEIERAIQEKTT